jgi:ribosomal protein S3
MYSLAVPSAEEFKAISDALCQALPADAVLAGLEVSSDLTFVTVWTTTPMAVIGSRGRIAESIQGALERATGKHVNFKVELADGDIRGEQDEPTLGAVSVARHDTEPAPRPRIPRPQ